VERERPTSVTLGALVAPTGLKTLPRSGIQSRQRMPGFRIHSEWRFSVLLVDEWLKKKEEAAQVKVVSTDHPETAASVTIIALAGVSLSGVIICHPAVHLLELCAWEVFARNHQGDMAVLR